METNDRNARDQMTGRTNQSRARFWRRVAASSVGGALLARAGLASALVVAVLPAAMFVMPPASVLPGFAVGPDIHVFNERQNVILPVNVVVNAQPVNLGIQTPADLNPGVIPAGTCVSSHYVQYQPALFAMADGGARFDRPILGVALLQGQLDASNFLGAPGTAYPTAADCNLVAGVDCGMELTPQDGLRIDPFRVRVHFEAESPGDRIRVITLGDPQLCHPWQPGPDQGDSGPDQGDSGPDQGDSGPDQGD